MKTSLTTRRYKRILPGFPRGGPPACPELFTAQLRIMIMCTTYDAISGDDMKVLILCGGRGMRMHELTRDMPKPLVPIAGMPMLWHIMKLTSIMVLTILYCCWDTGRQDQGVLHGLSLENHSFILDTENSRITLLRRPKTGRSRFWTRA